MDWTGQDDGNGPISVGRDRLLGLRLLPWIDKIVNTIEIFEKQIEYYVEVLCEYVGTTAHSLGKYFQFHAGGMVPTTKKHRT